MIEICAVPEGSDPCSGDVTIERATFFQPELCFWQRCCLKFFPPFVDHGGRWSVLKHVLGDGKVYQLISRPQCEHFGVGCLAQWYLGSALKVSGDNLLSCLAHTGS